MGVGRAAERVGTTRDAHDQEPRARQRQRQEAVRPEGHRPAPGRVVAHAALAASAASVFGPQPRSYTYQLPKKVELGALRAAFLSKLRDGAIVVVDGLKSEERKTKVAAQLLKRLGATRRTMILDVQLDPNFAASARNLPGVSLVVSHKVTARDVMVASRVIVTRAAVERLQEVLR